MLNVYTMEFGAVLAVSPVQPYDVEEVVAGWVATGQNYEQVSAGFVVRFKTGYYYLTLHRDITRYFSSSSCQFFKEEPKHLYQRAREWEFDKEVLNGRTFISKQEAKYPAASGTISGHAEPGQVVRIPF